MAICHGNQPTRMGMLIIRAPRRKHRDSPVVLILENDIISESQHNFTVRNKMSAPPNKITTGNGGARHGAGRPKGSVQKLTTQAREQAKEMGLLPHEWLLKITRGEPIVQSRWVDVVDSKGKITGREVITGLVYPDLQMRQDSAKAAAPYYAPRLATQVVTIRGREDLLNSFTDQQLDEAIIALEKETKPRKKVQSGTH